MSFSQMLSVVRPVPSRRAFLTLTALAAAATGAPLLAGCRGGAGPRNDGGGAWAAASGGTPTAASPAPTGFQELEAHIMGQRVTAQISPLVRLDETAMALVLELTRAADDTAVSDVRASASDHQDAIYAGTYLGGMPATKGANHVRLIDSTGTGRVWTAGSATGGALKLAPGDTVTSAVIFKPVDVDEITVLIPQTGFVRVRVIDRDAAADAEVSTEALGEADKIIRDKGGPGEDAAVVPLERYTQALDESAGTRTTDKDVTVTLASDVTFDSDSYNLTAAADAQLQTVASQIAQHPDGGTLDIVGHTDDVADDAHNQTLSENRAGAVKDRLGQLTDLAAWQVTTTGKGETEPAVDDTTDQARAANRRVVITITPTGGTTAKQPGATGSATPSSNNDSLPEAQGPVGTGPDGVTVPGPASKGGQITITLPQVVRAGGLLLGRLEITTGPGGTGDTNLTTWLSDLSNLITSNSRGENGGVSAVAVADGLTLLADGQRVFASDFLSTDHSHHIPLTETYTYISLKEGATITICCAWPDTGQDTLTLDHQGQYNKDGYAYRLTDIPITEN